MAEGTSVSSREPIWLLTVLMVRFDAAEIAQHGPIKRSRAWGWFPTRERAIEAAVSNEGDMYECCHYNAAVIEEIPWGAMAMTESELWFSVTPIPPWEGEYRVEEIDKPAVLAQVCGFGMG